MTDRFDKLTASLVDSGRKAAERLLQSPDETTTRDAAHAIHTLANMVEVQHRTMKAALAGILLKGWRCGKCQSFNGEEKELRSECRSCGEANGVR